MYDQRCLSCGYIWEAYLKYTDHPLCPQCQSPSERIVLQCPAVQADSVPGGFLIENLHTTPKRYYSKSEYRDDLRAAGCRIRDHHVQTAEGGDRNPNCGSKWY